MEAAPLGTSSAYAARHEMMEDLAGALGPFLRDQLPRGVPVSASVSSPPVPLAIVCHIGVERPDAMMDAHVMAIMDAARKVASRVFPTLPLVFEVLRPPANRYGFVAHLGSDAPQPVYPRFVSAKARIHLAHGAHASAGELLAALKGG